MSGLEHAPSWFLVIVIGSMVAIGGPAFAFILIRYLDAVKERMGSFDEKLERLVTSLSAFTPISQHVSAYDKLHGRVDTEADQRRSGDLDLDRRVTRLEDRPK